MPATSGDTRGGAHTVKLDGPEAVTTRASFIDGSAERDLILSTGLHGWLRKLGLVHSPTAAEVARHRRVQIVAAQWAGPRTIAVVNGKGGVGKTPTTAMLSAVYARFGGGSVLAFDNNDTRGTLGWRTEQGRHESTIADLLAAADSLQGAPTSAMAAYIHHQTDDRYDVLRSNPRVLSADQRLTTREFDTLVSTVGRGYRLVVFDSGNDESADRWLRMIDWANQLVVPTVTSPESAESAALLLEALAARDEHSALLARDAVVVITQAEPAGKARVAQLVETFSSLARAVAVIPFDPALKDGPLRFGALRAATREAWIEAAAYTADRF
ncbi:AAA family ATPase [Microbacterium rhizosphaerae]